MFVPGTAALGAAVSLVVTTPKPFRERSEIVLAPVVTRERIGAATRAAAS